MNIDWTISAGQVLVSIPMLAAFIGAFFSMRADIRCLNLEVTTMKMLVGKITDILIEIGQQKVRLDTIQGQIEDLRRGDGYVLSLQPRRVFPAKELGE